MGFDPYGPAARWYDRLSGERLVYRSGRLTGLRLLRLRRGDSVLDLGCGTGLSFSWLAHAVGPDGLLLGIDRSPHMLAVAAARPRVHWPTVRLLRADATDLDPDRVRDALVEEGRAPQVDGLVATYALSLMADWDSAWRRAAGLVRPGGRAVVVDMAVPRGPAALPARLAMRLGGADPAAHPWRAVERNALGVQSRTLRAGHIRVVGGMLPGAEAR